jgi:hypothetical protein
VVGVVLPVVGFGWVETSGSATRTHCCLPLTFLQTSSVFAFKGDIAESFEQLAPAFAVEASAATAPKHRTASSVDETIALKNLAMDESYALGF